MPDRDDTNHLLEAMEALVNPIRSKVIQDGPVGSGLAGQQTVEVVLPSLLDQLNEAIRGTIGIGGSGSLPWQRNMLDADALFRFATISSTIQSWAHLVDSEITADNPGKTLRAWYVKFVAANPTVEREHFYTAQMRGWAIQIRAKLDPPRVHDLPDPCPVCEATSWWNPADKAEYLRPLIVEYRETGPNLIQEAKALCRACAAVWGVRELAYLIEQAEKHAEPTA